MSAEWEEGYHDFWADGIYMNPYILGTNKWIDYDRGFLVGEEEFEMEYNCFRDAYGQI